MTVERIGDKIITAPLESKPTVRKTRKMLELEELYGQEIGEVLYGLYWEKNKSIQEVANELSLVPLTVRNWFERLDIKIRSASDTLIIYYQTHPEDKRKRKKQNTQAAQSFREALGVGSEDEFKSELVELYRDNRYSLTRVSRAISQMGDTTVSRTAVKRLFDELGLDKISDIKRLIEEAKKNGDFWRLTDKRREILELRYNVEGKVPTLKECAGKLGIRTQAAQQHEDGGLKTIRELKRGRT